MQRGSTHYFQLFKTANRGWSVRTLNDIPKGSFVCEYVGEIITDEEAEQREDDSFLFELDNRQCFKDSVRFVCDAIADVSRLCGRFRMWKCSVLTHGIMGI